MTMRLTIELRLPPRELSPHVTATIDGTSRR